MDKKLLGFTKNGKNIKVTGLTYHTSGFEVTEEEALSFCTKKEDRIEMNNEILKENKEHEILFDINGMKNGNLFLLCTEIDTNFEVSDGRITEIKRKQIIKNELLLFIEGVTGLAKCY